MSRVNIGLDFFDASINRLGAYVIGSRAVKKAFIQAFLEPASRLAELEEKGQLFERLALMEELKTKLFGAVWDYYCLKCGVPVAEDYIAEVQEYRRRDA